MPPKAGNKKNADNSEAQFMRAARFGRVKNTLQMGFGTFTLFSYNITLQYRFGSNVPFAVFHCCLPI